jgi:hypothetical protein
LFAHRKRCRMGSPAADCPPGKLFFRKYILIFRLHL